MRDRVNNTNDLQKRIEELKETERMQIAEIRYTATQLGKSMAPGNLIKNAISNVAASPSLRNSLLNTAIGLGTGFVGKKLFVGKSRNIFKKLGGTAIEFVLANLVRKKIPSLRAKVRPTNGVEKE
jgi:hypothetical protein